MGDTCGFDSLRICVGDGSGGAIYLGGMLDHPIHAQDGIKTRYQEGVELSWELDLVDVDFESSTDCGSSHFGGGGLNYQKMVQRGNR